MCQSGGWGLFLLTMQMVEQGSARADSFLEAWKGIALLTLKEHVALDARHTGYPKEKIEQDIRRPKYFSPQEAIEYGIIDKMIH